MNGTGIGGLAGRTRAKLRRLGYDVVGVGNAAPAATTTVTYSGTAQADSAYTLMTALRSSPAAQDLVTEPSPVTGTAGPVTLILGSDFAGVKPPPTPQPGKASHGEASHGKQGRSKHGAVGGPGGGSYGTLTFVQSRNAGASICSGLPASNRNSGSPP